MASLEPELQELANLLFSSGRWSEMAIEQTIAKLEDLVMPWHGNVQNTVGEVSSTAPASRKAGAVIF
jgi:hypothetical protein